MNAAHSSALCAKGGYFTVAYSISRPGRYFTLARQRGYITLACTYNSQLRGDIYFTLAPNYFFQNNVIVTLSWNPPPPPPKTSHLRCQELLVHWITVAFELPLVPLCLAVIPLDELLILSSLDDRKLYLLSPEPRCQTVLSVYTDIFLADKTSCG